MLFRCIFAAFAIATLTTYVFFTFNNSIELKPIAFANSHTLAKPGCLTSRSLFPHYLSGWPTLATQRTLIAHRTTVDTDVMALDRIA